MRRVLARGPISGRVSRVAFFLIVAARDGRRRGARATLFFPHRRRLRARRERDSLTYPAPAPLQPQAPLVFSSLTRSLQFKRSVHAAGVARLQRGADDAPLLAKPFFPRVAGKPGMRASRANARPRVQFFPVTTSRGGHFGRRARPSRPRVAASPRGRRSSRASARESCLFFCHGLKFSIVCRAPVPADRAPRTPTLTSRSLPQNYPTCPAKADSTMRLTTAACRLCECSPARFPRQP